MSEEIIKGVLLMLACFVPPIIIIAYDKFKYHRYYKRKFIYLRRNTENDRKLIAACGLSYSMDCKMNGSVWLFAYLGSTVVSGLGSSSKNLQPKEVIAQRLIEEKKAGALLIDCGTDIKKFIALIKSYKKL